MANYCVIACLLFIYLSATIHLLALPICKSEPPATNLLIESDSLHTRSVCALILVLLLYLFGPVRTQYLLSNVAFNLI